MGFEFSAPHVVVGKSYSMETKSGDNQITLYNVSTIDLFSVTHFQNSFIKGTHNKMVVFELL